MFIKTAKFTGNLLCWSHFLIKLQVSRPVTSLKSDPSKSIFLWSLAIFQKSIFTEHLWITAPADSSFFPFYYWWLQLWEFVPKGFKSEDLFYFLQQFIPKLTWMLMRFCLGNNLPMHRENTDLHQQLLSPEANFEGCPFYISL